MTTTKHKKMPCPDCRQCQGCSESRCRVCRGNCKSNPLAGLSMREQIELFDQINAAPQPLTELAVIENRRSGNCQSSGCKCVR